MATANGNTTLDASKITEVKVTIEAEKESAQIVYLQTSKVLAIAFSLQSAEENESVFNRDALHDGSVLFLKSVCQRAIQQWDALVTKCTKLQKYALMTRAQTESALKINPKYKHMWDVCSKATAIKNQLK